eukprot:gene16778-22782_t
MGRNKAYNTAQSSDKRHKKAYNTAQSSDKTLKNGSKSRKT